MSLICVLLSLLATFNENIFVLLNCFPKLSGVSFARSCPFAIITVREHTASTSSNATVTTDGFSGTITIAGYRHSGGNNTAIGFSVTASGTAGTGNAAEGVEYVIGATRSDGDNKLISTAVIVALESTVAGTLLNKIVSATLVGSSTVAELTTSALANSAAATEKTGWRAAHEDAPDARNAEDSVGGTASSAVTFTRTHWFN